MATERNMGSTIIRQGIDPRITNTNKAEASNFRDALWDKCAALSISIPCIGEKVFYFPQGHIEQVTAFTINGEPEPEPDTALESTALSVPSMMLCEIVHIQRMVEVYTDDLFAEITLLPKTEAPNLEVVAGPQPQRTRIYSFCKKLTASDISVHSGLSIPKKYAEECLPRLDMSLENPSQDLVTQDLQGVVWRFTHVFYGQPKRHMLTTGWSTFVGAKRLFKGDSFIFIRSETGELGVGVRRVHRGEHIVPVSLVSRYSKKLGIRGSAFHAMSSHTRFTIYYQPRTIHSEYIIPYDRCMTSLEAPYEVGMRFKMKVEFEKDKLEQRLGGTIVGVEDEDPLWWPGSRWRCLKVQWEDQLTKVVYPNKISPWNVELVADTNPMLLVEIFATLVHKFCGCCLDA